MSFRSRGFRLLRGERPGVGEAAKQSWPWLLCSCRVVTQAKVPGDSRWPLAILVPGPCPQPITAVEVVATWRLLTPNSAVACRNTGSACGGGLGDPGHATFSSSLCPGCPRRARSWWWASLSHTASPCGRDTGLTS